jgi:2-polyprenyl-6-methoxyphenol hydroxylase-like FAD-dependent oxidoreductase
MDYDVIVVGTRVAGSATALLLARQGVRVLAVDRARFPSDTLSTHQIQLPGVALLQQWGLLDAVVATSCPPATRVTFDAGPAVLRGEYPTFQSVDAVYSPRRTLLDAILRDAAAGSGAEVRDGFIVDSLVTEGDRVTGIRGTSKGGRSETLTARLVVGADGKRSMVARAVGAREYRTAPTLSGGCYGYFTDLPVDGGEVYVRPDRMVVLSPTNDGATVVYLAVPADRFDALRADLPGNFRALVAPLGNLADRLAAATPIEHLRASNDLPNTFRTPYGPGWALVGDAGLVMDPLTGQGIGNACVDADGLTRAIVAGLGGARPLASALADFSAARDRQRAPMYGMTLRQAAFRPDPSGAVLFPAIARDPHQTSRFLGVLTGAVPVDEFFAPTHLRRLVGVRGLARLVLARACPGAR